MSESAPTVQSSREEVWYLKEIPFGQGDTKRSFKIITQNFNGPCSFIAICNILILRGQIEILPPSRTTVSYEFLSQLVGEYLLTHCPDIDISAALTAMPLTQKGLDLNPLFTGATEFRPGGTGGELALFEHAGIKLVHGWLVDPESPEAAVMSRIGDYDSAVHLIADADHLTQGRLLVSEDNIPQAGSSSSSSAVETHGQTLSPQDRAKVEDAIVARRFIDATWPQLTYHGLFELVHTLQPGQLVALFRSSHLSVLYRAPEPDASIYSLVTDQSFLHEPSIVWERMEDVDGGAGAFVDANFVKSSPAGGDIVGQSAEDALRAAESLALNPFSPTDLALAQQLQAEEQEFARQQHAEHVRRKEERLQAKQAKEEEKERKKLKKKTSCVIM
ncbi:hypothetical protein HGRIS_000849 [Hohenbuehelia grisea]|uniref:MINDY deubiquitinase domain-containing protein n=1 Tax=Hohenbuehelia grisea TaxID=104357 RepID=A0ABR3IPX4_9AGAR